MGHHLIDCRQGLLVSDQRGAKGHDPDHPEIDRARGEHLAQGGEPLDQGLSVVHHR